MLYGENLDVDASMFLFNVNNQFNFKKGWSAELSGFYRSKGLDGQITIGGTGAGFSRCFETSDERKGQCSVKHPRYILYKQG